MRRRRTTAHEIVFALPLISGEYLNGVLPKRWSEISKNNFRSKEHRSACRAASRA
jgi:hypothetical protein